MRHALPRDSPGPRPAPSLLPAATPRGRHPLVRPGPSPTSRSGEPILKFNGKDLTGFYAYTKDHKYEDPKKVFTVVGRHDPHLGRGVTAASPPAATSATTT